MLKQYLDMLSESLKEKSGLLDSLLEATKAQDQLLSAEELDMEAFDQLVNAKDEDVNRLIRLDEGFENLYQKLKENLEAGKDQYKSQIKELQELIREVTEKGLQVEAQEKRNKARLEFHIKNEKNRIQRGRSTSRAAMNYYESMNRLGVNTPQFMDNRK